MPPSPRVRTAALGLLTAAVMSGPACQRTEPPAESRPTLEIAAEPDLGPNAPRPQLLTPPGAVLGGVEIDLSNSPPPEPGTAEVELFDPQAIVGLQRGRVSPELVLLWTVKYRFLRGGPEPGAWYTCHARGSGSLPVQAGGESLRTEGVFEREGPPPADADTITFTVTRRGPRGEYIRVCADVRCPVRDMLPVVDPVEPDPGLERLRRLGGKISRGWGGGEVLAVRLWGKEVADADLAALEPLVGLRELQLAYSGVSDASLRHLRGLTKLSELQLHGNPGVTDAGLAHLKGLSGLRLLMIPGTGVTDAGLEHLKGMTKLQALYAGSPGLGDAGLKHLQALSGLTVLSLTESRVTDAGLEHLKGMSQLEALYLDQTRVGDAGLTHLHGLAKLRELRLVRTRVTARGAEELRKALPGVNIFH